jgi:hypothetical protein
MGKRYVLLRFLGHKGLVHKENEMNICPKINSPCYLFSIFLFLMVGISHHHAQSFSTPTQVSGNLTAGPFEFAPPEGYWYFPFAFPKKGLQKGESFQLNFFKTREDMPPGGAYASPDSSANVIFEFSVTTPNEFKDINSYYDAVSKLYQSRGVTGISFKDLPKETKVLFRDTPGWHCQLISASVVSHK